MRHPERSAAGAQSKRARAIAFVAAVLTALAPPPLASAATAPIVQPSRSGTPWTADGIAKLDADLDAMLANDPTLRGAHYGVYAIDTATGAPLYSRNVDDEIQPASTFKLVVGSASLDRLGSNYVFTTGVYTSPDKREVVLRAGGDPFLSSADLQAAAKTAVTSGPYVFVDDRRFETEPYPRGWTWDDFGQSYAPRISAMALDEDVVHLIVSPAAVVGAAPHVAISAPLDLSIVPLRPPPSDAGAICGADWGHSHVSLLAAASTGAGGSEDTLDARLNADGCPEIVGKIPLDASPETLDLAVPDVRGYVSSTFSAFVNGARSFPLLRAVDRSETEPRISEATIPIWSHASAPLSVWLGPRFWIPSDNLVGEMLLRELGFVTNGAPGTTENGIAYEKTWLQSIGIDTNTVTLADGCGMSQYDRITPRDLVTILQHDWNGPNRQLVLDSLPVGGARGTIEGIAGSDAAGRVFAKTGSMMHVRGLAGYLAPEHHGAITFAFEVDDWNGEYPALAALRARVLSRLIDD